VVAALWQVKDSMPYHIDLKHDEIVDELARKIGQNSGCNDKLWACPAVLH
jgi:hypothetical protein